MLIVTKKVYHSLKPRTKAELLAAVFGSAGENADMGNAFDWEKRVSFSPGEIEEFMSTLSEETKAALKVFAENGSKIHASLLDGTGIDDYASFQRSTTRRTRTLTGGKDFLLAWDDWDEADDGVGHYAVTPATYRSLRIFFNLD